MRTRPPLPIQCTVMVPAGARARTAAVVPFSSLGADLRTRFCTERSGPGGEHAVPEVPMVGQVGHGTMDAFRRDLWRSLRDSALDPARLPRRLGRRGIWMVRIRWFVGPIMAADAGIAHALGFRFALVPVLAIAAATLAYNAAFAVYAWRRRAVLVGEPRADAAFLVAQVVADYAAMFLLLHVTGGAASPLAVFLTFHVILAAIQFSRGVAHLYAAIAAAGLWALLAADRFAGLSGPPVRLGDRVLFESADPVAHVPSLLAITLLLFVSAYLVGRVMLRLREQVGDLARVTHELTQADQRQTGLYAMIRAIGAEREPARVLSTVTTELSRLLEAPAVTIKLRDRDGDALRYAAAHGLPDSLVDDAPIPVADRPEHRAVLDGETRIRGTVDEEPSPALRADLTARGIRSVARIPLRLEDRVLGTLDVYAREDGGFGEQDIALLDRAGNLVAIAIENARAVEEIEALMEERTRFTLEVAHNLRAPLSATLGMIELLDQRYLGELDPRQAEYVERIEHRLRALHAMVGDLLTIGRTRDRSREIPDVVVDLDALVRKVERTYRREADRRRVRFRVVAEPDLPDVDSGADLLEQILENLLSNAVKYTPEDGDVELRVCRNGPDEVRILVRDTGIGIPAEEQERLFQEFFRASNARRWTRDGTGLGLTLVKKAVERHGGRLHLASDEREGTTVVVDLPVRQTRKVPEPA